MARQRLLTQIVGPSMAPVTIIVAPAGYGKTTLATQLAASMPGECVWLSISEKMNIPEFFLGRLLQRLGGSAPDGEPVHPEAVLDSLRELATRAPRVTLFLDDYHLVDSREIHHFMQRLLHDQPDNVHVVFMSRLPIPFALARDYVCDRVRCVTAEDLSFTVDEVRQLVAGDASINIDDASVTALVEHTQGWIAAIRLAISSAAYHGSDTSRWMLDTLSMNPWLDRYIMEEVLSSVSPAVRDFVLRTSFLPFLSVDLCNRALGIANSASLMSRLEQKSAFIRRLPDDPERLVFHALFATCVQRIATATLAPDEMRDIHRRAGAWLEHTREHDSALELALRTGDIPMAERMVRLVCTPLAREGRSVRLLRWLGKLPPASLRANGDFAFWFINAALNRGRKADAIPLLAEMLPIWERSADPVEQGYAAVSQGFLLALDGSIIMSLEHLYRALDVLPASNHLERFHALAQIAVNESLLGHDAKAEWAYREAERCRSFLPVHQVIWHMMLQPHRANHLALRGKLTEALQAYDYWNRHLPPTFATHGGMLASIVAAPWFEMNDLPRAHAEITASFRDFDLFPIDEWHASALILGARIAHAMGAEGEATEYLDLAQEKATLQDIQHALDRIRALRASWDIEAGNLIAAHAWEQQASAGDHHWQFTYGDLNTWTIVLQLRIAEGNPADAIDLANRLLEEAVTRNRWSEFVDLAMWLCVAQLASGNEEDARESLRRALSIGRPGGFVRAFSPPGHDLTAFLARACDVLDAEDAGYVRSLLSGGASCSSQQHASAGVSLTEREMEVLHLMATGLKNQEIAATLFITERTVKKHVSNLLGKMGTTTRTAAVNQAYVIGLLR